MDAEPQSPPGRSDLAAPAETVLACNCCRRRKLRCSREAPTCQQCRKTGSECVYETKRAKPGMKSGAIDNLHRRLDALERALAQKASREADHDGSSSTAPALPVTDPDHDRSAYGILSFFAKELQRFNAMPPRHDWLSTQRCTDSGRQGEAARKAKRRRLDDEAVAEQSGQSLGAEDSTWAAVERHQEAILRAYFTHIHPWIPIVHEGRLRRRLSDPSEVRHLRIILRAMALAAARFIDNQDVGEDLLRSEEDEDQARDWIICNATRCLSVENTQALIIISFNDIGSGFASRAWAIVGSLTRMVEYLQLANEHEETERQALSVPYISLPAAHDWTESEERRRVFWNVFCLDRFCSVTMGWNTSLTSDDVSRRLPCDGIAWRKEDLVTTPYFGIWDKSAGRIGNPIAFIPSHYAPHCHSAEEEAQTPSEAGISPAAPPPTIDMSTLGAFAYSIEATESLSRITTYFLQQEVNMRDPRDLSGWLTRFKELDLRLVHWKMLLPHKWKVNMARQSCRMDPNLTLAHVTHNASMILLHQLIAFPPLDWPFRSRLPSPCSVDTCLAAAVENATIAQNFLRNAPAGFPVASQFAFCLYIASRVLLIQWRYTSPSTLDLEFWSLVRSLDSIAQRWEGPHGSAQHANIAAQYSKKLTELHTKCSRDESFRIDVLGYTREINFAPAAIAPEPTASEQESEQQETEDEEAQEDSPEVHSGDILQLQPTQKERAPGLNGNTQARGQIQAQVMPLNFTATPESLPGPPADLISIEEMNRAGAYQRGSLSSVGNGELNAISQMLLGQQFMDMDRVISYDDGVFGTDYDGGW